MKPLRALFLLLALTSISFAARAQGPSPYPLTKAEDWDQQLGKQVLLIGTAQNEKLGAALLVEQRSVYVKDLSSWPPDLLNQMVRARGRLRKFDLPVATQKHGEWSAGVSQPGQAYRLEKAKYELDPSCLKKP